MLQKAHDEMKTKFAQQLGAHMQVETQKLNDLKAQVKNLETQSKLETEKQAKSKNSETPSPGKKKKN